MTHPLLILDPSHRSARFAGKCALTVMAKAPIPGKVKTRLSPPLTLEQASGLNACFLQDTIASLHAATLAAPAEWVICYTPEGAEVAFRDILPEGALLLPQRGDSFGERLLYSAEDLFACGFSAVCLIDSDSPTVPTSEFIAAATILLHPGERVVLGPSQDGGYYLIGLQAATGRLFEDITWSTASVTRETLERAAEIDLPVEMLQLWYDVDDDDSLGHICSELFSPNSHLSPGYPAPHTRKYLTALPNLMASIASQVETVD